MNRLTDPRVFDPPWNEARGDWEDVRKLLPGADQVHDIHLVRQPGAGALVDIEHRFVVHSPDGFEWGYGGSGPSELALNILALFVHPAEAWRLHHPYKDDVTARLSPEGPHTITAASVRIWIAAAWAGWAGPLP